MFDGGSALYPYHTIPDSEGGATKEFDALLASCYDPMLLAILGVRASYICT